MINHPHFYEFLASDHRLRLEDDARTWRLARLTRRARRNRRTAASLPRLVLAERPRSVAVDQVADDQRSGTETSPSIGESAA